MKTIHRPVLIALSLAAALGFSAPARAQSDSELRQENQRLLDEVQRLQDELAAAQQRIEALEREIEQLRSQRTTTGGGTPQPPEEGRISVDESVPEATPRAMRTAVQASHDEAMEGMEQGDTPDSRERRAYLAALQKWATSAERDFRRNIDWHVRVLEARDVNARTIALRLQAIDPQYGGAIGTPFVAHLARSRAQSLQQHGQGATYQIHGTARPLLDVNPNLETAEPFREDAFLGPYIEYGLAVDLTTMLQDDVEEDETPATTRPGR